MGRWGAVAGVGVVVGGGRIVVVDGGRSVAIWVTLLVATGFGGVEKNVVVRWLGVLGTLDGVGMEETVRGDQVGMSKDKPSIDMCEVCSISCS